MLVIPGAARSRATADAAGLLRITVLLVEDEPALRKLVARLLADRGYAVLQAGSGGDAVAVIEQHRGKIDLLLTDVSMPDISGPELARHTRELRPGLKVLFMSGYYDSGIVAGGVEPYEVHLLSKPFTPELLISRVAELTARSPPASPRPSSSGRGLTAGTERAYD